METTFHLKDAISAVTNQDLQTRHWQESSKEFVFI